VCRALFLGVVIRSSPAIQCNFLQHHCNKVEALGSGLNAFRCQRTTTLQVRSETPTGIIRSERSGCNHRVQSVKGEHDKSNILNCENTPPAGAGKDNGEHSTVANWQRGDAVLSHQLAPASPPAPTQQLERAELRAITNTVQHHATQPRTKAGRSTSCLEVTSAVWPLHMVGDLVPVHLPVTCWFRECEARAVWASQGRTRKRKSGDTASLVFSSLPSSPTLPASHQQSLADGSWRHKAALLKPPLQQTSQRSPNYETRVQVSCTPRSSLSPAHSWQQHVCLARSS